MGKYDHLVHTFKKQRNYWGAFMPPYQAYFRGHDCMPDSSFYSSYRAYMTDAFVDKAPSFHSEDEYLCFIGHDMTDPWGSFDAEIEFWIGKEINQLEQHIFTKPTIVRIPAFYWHCPLQYHNVKKPVYMQVLSLRGKFGTYKCQYDEKRGYYIEFAGSAGTKKCVFDPNAQCTFCGKCFKDRSKPDDPKNATEAALRYRDVKF